VPAENSIHAGRGRTKAQDLEALTDTAVVHRGIDQDGMMTGCAAPLAYLGVTNAFALLPMSDRDEDVEIRTLRHQITVLERQLGEARSRFSLANRAFLAALLRRLPGRNRQSGNVVPARGSASITGSRTGQLLTITTGSAPESGNAAWGVRRVQSV
jgi:hypothetical protein